MKFNLKIKKEDLRQKLGIKDPIELEGEQIVDKINELPLENDLKIDAKHIKNLPKGEGRIVAGAASRFKELTAGRNISITETKLGYPTITNTNPKITVSATAPSDPVFGDLWVKTI